MQVLYEQICQTTRAAGPVLICGRSGVGKELITRGLHEKSDRAYGPLLPVNCAGIPEGLLESELFGLACGAFAGAQRVRRGLFSEAHGGMVLLDEIGEWALFLQAKRLRGLRDGRVRPVGAKFERTVDVRTVAATHRDLPREVARREFREDLSYRLNTFKLQVSPLRQCGGDLRQRGRDFIRYLSAHLGCDIEGSAMRRLRFL